MFEIGSKIGWESTGIIWTVANIQVIFGNSRSNMFVILENASRDQISLPVELVIIKLLKKELYLLEEEK